MSSHQQRAAPNGRGFRYVCDVVGTDSEGYRGRVVVLERRASSRSFDPPLVLYTPALYAARARAQQAGVHYAREVLRCATDDTLLYLASLAPCRCARAAADQPI